MKSLIQRIFKLFNYELIRKKSIDNLRELSKQRGVNTGNTMEDSMHRLKALGIIPYLIVDIGAAKGKWTEKAQSVWPDSEYILVEPLKEQIEQISQILKNSPKVSIIEAVAGSESDVISFNVSSDLDGSGVYGGSENTRELPVIKLDDNIKVSNGGILLKLDTHGYEIPIFKGSEKILEKTAAVIVEVYGFYVSPSGLLFHEISDYLLKKGFRLYDIADIMRRDSDKAFWQADAVYLKSTNNVFSSNNYKE